MAPKNEQRDLSSSLPVRIQFLNETGQEYDQIHCLGRIIPLTDRKKVCVPGSYLPFNLTDLSSMGADNSFCVGVRTNQEPNLFTIAPKIWKCAYQLPRKRRQGVDYRMCLEVMIVGSKIPFVSETLNMKKALQVISNKKLGTLIVQNNKKNTTGIITDGQIRRFNEKNSDLKNLIVKKVMTLNPISISQDTLAEKALSIMNTEKITSLCVHNGKNKKKTIGILHIHNILETSIY